MTGTFLFSRDIFALEKLGLKTTEIKKQHTKGVPKMHFQSHFTEAKNILGRKKKML